MKQSKLVALILFGVGAVLGVVGVTNWAIGCISAGLFVEAL